MMQKKIVCKTSGNGIWSSARKAVTITALEIAYLNNGTLLNSDYGELRVYFDSSWKVETDGVIYTDPLWLRQFKEYLASTGFSEKATSAVDYSVLGMQSDYYVSLDIDKDFIRECDPLVKFVNNNQLKIDIVTY